MFSGLEQPVFCTSDMTLPTPLRARGALKQNYGMKRTLLFALALIAVGCADDAGQSALCEGLFGPQRDSTTSGETSLEDVRSCAEQGINRLGTS